MESKKHNCIAALMTAKGVAAISSIQLVGDNSENIIKKIFKPITAASGGLPCRERQGLNILHGNIFDGEKNIDEVIIGCEAEDSFSINCHGNPIIVENILELLKKHGVKIAEPEEIIAYIARKKYGDNAIVIEAEISAAQSATLEGAKIIQHQTKIGLLQTAEWWLKNLDRMQIDDVKAGAEQILADSKISDLFINGAKIVISGPPNSGKSTLFNFFCGKEKAIVTDIAGTTRDWLSAKVRLKRIEVEFFDTAGIDETLSGKNIIDAQSQARAMELIEDCDLVLMVMDSRVIGNQPPPQVRGLNNLVVFNKCDLGESISGDELKISAKNGIGIKELITEIEWCLGIIDFDIKKTVCFTERQRKIVQQIVTADTKQQIKYFIQELLKGNLN